VVEHLRNVGHDVLAVFETMPQAENAHPCHLINPRLSADPRL
jgi:hypothetical protein